MKLPRITRSVARRAYEIIARDSSTLKLWWSNRLYRFFGTHCMQCAVLVCVWGCWL